MPVQTFHWHDLIQFDSHRDAGMPHHWKRTQRPFGLTILPEIDDLLPPPHLIGQRQHTLFSLSGGRFRKASFAQTTGNRFYHLS